MSKVTVKKEGSFKNPVKYKMIDTLTKEFQKEVAKDAQRLFDAANKRIKRIEQAGLTESPAYIANKKKGGKFSGRGLKNAENWNLLMHEYGRVINFLNMETSTLGGARKYEKKIISLIGDNVEGDKREIIFAALSRIEELGNISAEIYGSDRLIQEIANKIDEDTYFDFMSMEKGSRKWNEKLDTIIEGIKKDVDEFYRQEIGNDNADGLDVDYFLSLDYDNDVDNFEE